MTTRRPTEQLARPDFAEILRYAPGPRSAVNLAENTNLWGTPPAAAAVLTKALLGGVSEYPDMYADGLKSTVAKIAGVGVDCVVTGNGSDDVLDCALRAFASPGDRVAHPDPTFVMLPAFSRINNLVPVPVPLAPNFEMDCDALLATGARIIYLCSPNNPVPVATNEAAMRRLIANAPGLVIVDEAYAEFMGSRGLLSDAPKLERVLVCRTLSKAYGLAGLRVGYGTASPAIVEVIEKSRGPFKVNALAECAAVAALTDDHAWVVDRAAAAVESRDRLADELRKRGFTPLPSAANFLLVPTPTAFDQAARLFAAGLGVRAFRNLPRIGDALRITAGPWDIMERVLEALG